MIGLSLKFREARLIRTMSNKALFSVEEVQGKEEERKKEDIDFNAHPSKLSWAS